MAGALAITRSANVRKRGMPTQKFVPTIKTQKTGTITNPCQSFRRKSMAEKTLRKIVTSMIVPRQLKAYSRLQPSELIEKTPRLNALRTFHLET